MPCGATLRRSVDASSTVASAAASVACQVGSMRAGEVERLLANMKAEERDSRRLARQQQVHKKEVELVEAYNEVNYCLWCR